MTEDEIVSILPRGRWNGEKYSAWSCRRGTWNPRHLSSSAVFCRWETLPMLWDISASLPRSGTCGSMLKTLRNLFRGSATNCPNARSGYLTRRNWSNVFISYLLPSIWKGVTCIWLKNSLHFSGVKELHKFTDVLCSEIGKQYHDHLFPMRLNVQENVLQQRTMCCEDDLRWKCWFLL